MTSTYLIFQLGTNNWQSENEPAPGSGILHAAHHAAYLGISNVKCYSVFPSGRSRQTNAKLNRSDVRIMELDDDIPICESAGPISKRRWHGMSSEAVISYRTDLEALVSKYMDEIESTEQKPIDLVIAHHSFMNPVILSNVITKRYAYVFIFMAFCPFFQEYGGKLKLRLRRK